MDEHIELIMSIEHSNTTSAECENLYSLAKDVVEGFIVEIGSYHGRTTVALALAVQASGYDIPIFCIEPHEYSRAVFGHEFGSTDRVHFFRNMLNANVVQNIRLINYKSQDAARAWDASNMISLLWIDGDHTYEGAKLDFESWEKFVPIGGIVAIHDTLPPFIGPQKVVEEALASSRYVLTQQVERNAVLKKVRS